MRLPAITGIVAGALIAVLTSPVASGSEEQGVAETTEAKDIGIHVHGHWKVVVLDADGTKVQEIEFDNALQSPGTLTTLLMDDAVSGGLYLVASDQNAMQSGVGPCDPDCEISEAGMGLGVTPNSTDLTQTQQGSNFETLRLAGSVTVSNNATIDLLQTWILICNGETNTASQCRSSPDSEGVFTSKNLSQGAAVTSGQVVQITVDITFN